MYVWSRERSWGGDAVDLAGVAARAAEVDGAGGAGEAAGPVEVDVAAGLVAADEHERSVGVDLRDEVDVAAGGGALRAAAVLERRAERRRRARAVPGRWPSRGCGARRPTCRGRSLA